MTTVVNKYKDRYDVYIGRGSIWGNRWVIGRDGTREEVIEKYRIYFNERIEKDEGFRNETRKLKGKILGCFCFPLACHGNVIINWLDSHV